MRRHTIYILSLGILMLLAFACGQRPRYVLPENKMAEVLYDIRLAEAIYNVEAPFRPDSMKDMLIAGVLEKHNITQADLDSSLYWYSEKISLYAAITDTVTARLRARGDSYRMLNERRDRMRRAQSGYMVPPYYRLSDATPMMSFNMDSFLVKSTNLESFLLKFDVQGLNQLNKLNVGMFYKYTDTTIYEQRNIYNDSINFVFNKPNKPDSLLRQIAGYVRLENREGIKPLSDVLLYNIAYSDSTLAKQHGTEDNYEPGSNNTPQLQGNVAKDEAAESPRRDMPVVAPNSTQRRLNKGLN